jgi:hypothetical protein
MIYHLRQPIKIHFLVARIINDPWGQLKNQTVLKNALPLQVVALAERIGRLPELKEGHI